MGESSCLGVRDVQSSTNHRAECSNDATPAHSATAPIEIEVRPRHVLLCRRRRWRARGNAGAVTLPKQEGRAGASGGQLKLTPYLDLIYD